jgi:hypothetical protein
MDGAIGIDIGGTKIPPGFRPSGVAPARVDRAFSRR